jgi:hypothetical protein
MRIVVSNYNLEQINSGKFYVYVIYDPRQNNVCPIYVGKGKGKRIAVHARRACNDHLNRTLRLCNKLRLDVPAKITAYFTNEDAAFLLEKTLIAQYGRLNLGTGTLYNLTEGGEGVADISPETRLIHAECMRKNNANLEYQEKIRKGQQKYQADPIVAEANLERLRKINANPKFAKANLERLRKYNADPEFRNKARKEQQRYYTDPIHAKEQSERTRKQNADPEFRKKLREGHHNHYAEQRAKRGPQPWVVAGVPRATWYYRRRKAKKAL